VTVTRRFDLTDGEWAVLLLEQHRAVATRRVELAVRYEATVTIDVSFAASQRTYEIRPSS
jgi:hypothetical protein